MSDIVKLSLLNKKTTQNSINEVKTSKHFPSSVREWNNSIYVYNENGLDLIPNSTVSAIKIIKSYFSLYNNKIERKIRTKRLLLRFRRLSSNKIYISNGEFKHTNNKVTINLYLFNRQKYNYMLAIKKLYLKTIFDIKHKKNLKYKNRDNKSLNRYEKKNKLGYFKENTNKIRNIKIKNYKSKIGTLFAQKSVHTTKNRLFIKKKVIYDKSNSKKVFFFNKTNIYDKSNAEKLLFIDYKFINIKPKKVFFYEQKHSKPKYLKSNHIMFFEYKLAKPKYLNIRPDRFSRIYLPINNKSELYPLKNFVTIFENIKHSVYNSIDIEINKINNIKFDKLKLEYTKCLNMMKNFKIKFNVFKDKINNFDKLANQSMAKVELYNSEYIAKNKKIINNNDYSKFIEKTRKKIKNLDLKKFSVKKKKIKCTSFNKYIAKKVNIIKRKSLLLLKLINKEKYLIVKTLKKDNNKIMYFYILSYITKFYKRFVKRSLRKLKLYFYYRQLLYLNRSKYNYNYLQYLNKFLYSLYNKNIEYNLINLKRFYLHSDILSESIKLKLNQNKKRILRKLNTVWKKVKTKNNKVFLGKKPFIKKLDYKKNTTKLANSLKNNIIGNLNYKDIKGFRLEARGRLTRRYTASRSVLKTKYKGNLLNIDSFYKGLSTVLLKNNLRSNLQYTKLKSKSRIGSFGIKGWISGN